MLEKQLIVDFKKRKLGDLRAHNFVDVSNFVKQNLDYLIKTMASRDPAVIWENFFFTKIFLNKFQGVNFRENFKKFQPKQESSFKSVSYYPGCQLDLPTL